MADTDPAKVAFELVSPERLLHAIDVDMVVVPGEEGDFGVLPGHAPLISALRNGVVEVHDGNSIIEHVFVAGGYAEATPARCTVLAEEALPLADVSRADAEARLAAADQAIDDAIDDAARAHGEAARDTALALIEALDYYKL